MDFTKLIEENKDKFQGSSFFGVSIADMKPDELRACICFMGNIQKQDRKDTKAVLDLLNNKRTI